MKHPSVIHCGILLLIIRLVFGELFLKKSDFRLDDVTGTGCLSGVCSVSRATCAMICQSSSTCHSFNYRKSDGACQLNNKQIYDFGARAMPDTQWEYFGPYPTDVKEDDWILAFIGKSGINVPVTTAWDEVGLAHDLDLRNQDPLLYSKYTISVPTHYRTHWLDVWDTSAIAKVRLVLYTNGIEVASMVFNGTGSTKDDWFSATRLLSSSWNDLKGSSTAYFSITGQYYRTFYITLTASFSECANKGWLIVLKRKGNRCPFDKNGPLPQFLYSVHSDQTNFKDKDYGLAELMAVFIKMS